MFGKFFAVFLLILINQKCDARSFSVAVKHQQYYTVEDIEDRGHISVSDVHTKQLQLTSSTNDGGSENQDQGLVDEPNLFVENSNHDDGRQFTEPAFGGNANSDNENEIVDGNYEDYDFDDDDDNDDDDDDDDDVDDDDDDDYDVEDGIKSTSLEDFMYADPEIVHDEVNSDEFNIESISGLKKLFRKRRSAQEQWKQSLPGAEPAETTNDDEPDIWNEVTDEELKLAQVHTYKQAAEYIGLTLLSVVFFVFIGICFIRDPIACIFAFGTGCPCCLLCCPCFRAFTKKYLDMKKIVRNQMNKYMPGVIVNDDGTLDYYQPTGDELDILAEIIEEVQEM